MDTVEQRKEDTLYIIIYITYMYYTVPGILSRGTVLNPCIFITNGVDTFLIFIIIRGRSVCFIFVECAFEYLSFFNCCEKIGVCNRKTYSRSDSVAPMWKKSRNIYIYFCIYFGREQFFFLHFIKNRKNKVERIECILVSFSRVFDA